MRNERILTFTVFIGLFLSISGVFLPWGKEEWGPWYTADPRYLAGVLLLLGTIAMIGDVAAAVFMVLHLKRKQRYWLVSVFSGGLIALFCSLAWISNPDALKWYWDWRQGYGLCLTISSPSYKVLYGAYISLAGSIVTSIGAILKFLRGSTVA